MLRPHAIPLRHNIETPQGEHSPADVNDSSSQSHAGDTSSPDEGIVVLHDKTSLNISKTVDVDKVTRKFREFLLFGHKKVCLSFNHKIGAYFCNCLLLLLPFLCVFTNLIWPQILYFFLLCNVNLCHIHKIIFMHKYIKFENIIIEMIKNQIASSCKYGSLSYNQSLPDDNFSKSHVSKIV